MTVQAPAASGALPSCALDHLGIDADDLCHDLFSLEHAMAFKRR
jgi:hypothetical protein